MPQACFVLVLILPKQPQGVYFVGSFINDLLGLVLAQTFRENV